MSDGSWPTKFPSEPATYGNLHVGDTHDDDANIIDADVLEVDAAPTPIVEPIETPPVTSIPPATRLLTNTLTVDPTWTVPTLMLPADTRRKGLNFRVTSPTAVVTDYVAIADDPGKLQAANGALVASAARIYHGDNIDLDVHTGAVWVTSFGSSAVVTAVIVATSL